MAYSVSASNTLDTTVLQDLDAVATTNPGIPLGTEVMSTDGRKYKYVVTEVVCVIVDHGGIPAYYIGGAGGGPIVTSDASAAATAAGGLGSAFAGLFCAGIAATTVQYVWIEVPNGAVTPDASVSTNCVASSALSAIGTADAYLDVFVNGASTKIVAIALEADTSQLADIVMLPEPSSAQ